MLDWCRLFLPLAWLAQHMKHAVDFCFSDAGDVIYARDPEAETYAMLLAGFMAVRSRTA